MPIYLEKEQKTVNKPIGNNETVIVVPSFSGKNYIKLIETKRH